MKVENPTPRPIFKDGVPMCSQHEECCHQSMWEQYQPCECKITKKATYISSLCVPEVTKICSDLAEAEGLLRQALLLSWSHANGDPEVIEDASQLKNKVIEFLEKGM